LSPTSVSLIVNRLQPPELELAASRRRLHDDLVPLFLADDGAADG
jgi:hypothetical protein